MSVDVLAEVEIARSQADVAAYMFDPRHDAEWTTGVVEVHPKQGGRLRPGAKVERVSKFLGRRLEYLIEVIDAGEDFVEMHSAEPFEMRVRYELEAIDEGRTTTRIRAAGGGTGFYRMAAPLLAKMVRRSIRADLDQLKLTLEDSPK